MSLPAPVVCEPSPSCCAGSAPFYGQGRTFLNAETGFILDCPQGFSCLQGAYPVPIIVKQGEVHYTPPTNGGPLRATCCTGEILVRYLPDRYTQAQFDAQAQSLVDALAVKLAGCKAAAYNAQYARKIVKHLHFVPFSITDTCVGETFSSVFDAADGTEPYVFELNGGTLPPGLELNAEGNLFGTPTTPGFYSFSVKVTDDLDATAVAPFTMSVMEITTASPLPAGTVGTPYSQAIAESGGVLPVTWSVVAGALPPGVALNASTGLLAGTPTLAGSYSFTIALTSS